MPRSINISALLCVVATAASAAAPIPESDAEEAPVTRSERDHTLVGSKIESGGYAGPRVAFGRVAERDAVLAGFEAGWIVNHRFILGAGGYGLVTNQSAPGAFAATDNLIMGYGGLVLGYTLLTHEVVHPTLTVLVGGGGLGRRAHSSGDVTSLDDAFLAVEPAGSIDINVAEHFRLGLALSYRWVRGVDSPGITNSDLSGPFGSVALKFGVF